MSKQARMSLSYACVRLTVPLLDSFANFETVSLLKFHDEEPSSVRLMDIVSGTIKYVLFYQEERARGLT